MTSTTQGVPFRANPAPQASSWTDPAVNPWYAYYGDPQVSTPVPPFDAKDESTYDLPAAYIGQSRPLGNTLDIHLLSRNDFLTSVIFPKVMTNQIKTSYSKMEAVPALPNRVPHFGVVRFVKTRKIHGSGAMQRYGLGLYQEHGFMLEREGQLIYATGIIQLINAFAESMQFEVLYNLVTAGNYEINWILENNGYTPEGLNRMRQATIEREVFLWGVIQQNRNAWEILNNYVDRTVEKYNQTAPLDTWILDIRTITYLALIPYDTNTNAVASPNAIKNPRFAQNFMLAPDGVTSVYLTKGFLVDEFDEINPLQHDVQIGEYFFDRDFFTNYGVYKTTNRETMFYDQVADNWVPMGLDVKFMNSNRFDDNGNLIDITTISNNVSNKTEKIKSDFLHRVNANGQVVPLRYVGQMREQHFPLQDYRNFVETALHQLTSTDKTSDFAKAIFDLRENLMVISKYTYTNAFDQYAEVLARKNPGLSENISSENRSVLSSLSVTPNEYGSLNLPLIAGANAPDLGLLTGTGFVFGSTGWTISPYHGNYPGFQTIRAAMLAGNYTRTGFSLERGATIRDAITVFDKLVDNLKRYCPNSPVLVPAYASPNYSAPSAHVTVFENLVARDIPSRPVFLHISHPTANRRFTNLVENVEYGTTPGSYATQRVEERSFPEIASLRRHIMDTILGNLVAGPAVAQADVFIGEAISGSLGGQVYRAAPIQTPKAAVAKDGITKFAEQRWGGAAAFTDTSAAGPGLDFNAADPAAPNLENAPNNFDIVYDTLARWVLLPGPPAAAVANQADFTNKLNFYAAQNYIIAALATARIIATNPDATMRNIAAIIDTIQSVVNVRMHATDTPSVGANAAALGAMQDIGIIDRLANAVATLRRERPEVFNQGVTLDFFGRLRSDILTHRETIASRSERDNNFTGFDNAAVADNTGVGYHRHRNADLSLYRAAPISIGREAAMAYTQFAYEAPGIRRIIPASFQQPGTHMSEEELDMARALVTNSLRVNESSIQYAKYVGHIFAPPSLLSQLSADIDMLPVLRSIHGRQLTPDEVRYQEQAEEEQARRERRVATRGTNNSIQQLLRADSEALRSSKRQRTVDTVQPVRTSLFDTVVSGSAGSRQGPVLEDSEITASMRQMYTNICYDNVLSDIGKIIAIAWLFTPIHLTTFIATYNFNLLHLVDYMICRPYMTYEVVDGIKLRRGIDTGETNFGHIQVELGDDPNIGAHMMGALMYHGVTIKDLKRIFVAQNILVTGYKSGAAHGIIKREDFNPRIGKFGSHPDDSLIIKMIPRHSNPPIFHNMSGRQLMSDRMGHTEALDEWNAEVAMATSDVYYDGIWSFGSRIWNNPLHRTGADSARYSHTPITPNDVVIRSAHRFRDPISGLFSDEHSDVQHGHFKQEAVGKNVGDARLGKKPFLNLPVAGSSSRMVAVH